MNNVNLATFPDGTYLSTQNQDSVQTYVCITIGLNSLLMNMFLF
jgi:hypothetical protein